MHDFFYGWYMKCQSENQTLAIIPSFHQAKGKCDCYIQIITNTAARSISFSPDTFRKTNQGIRIADNYFGKHGILLSIETSEIKVKGKLRFGPLSPLKYDIMGPFTFIPFLECRHSVFSMRHPVCGMVSINDKPYSFQDGWGYWEGDRGRSFPKEYAWTQCCFPGGSLMLSVADIPLAGIHFTGIIGIVLWQGREYRLATYLGAKAVKIESGTLRITQGDLTLEAHLLKAARRPLKASSNGSMTRIIHESAACRASYRFRKKDLTIFAFETELASFEYEYPY